LDACAFPADTHGPCPVRRHASLRNTPIRAQGAHPDWGTLVYNYGRNEVKTISSPRPLLARQVPTIDGLRVTPSPHALPRLLPQARRVDSQSIRRSRESSRYRFHQAQNEVAHGNSPASSPSPRNHFLAPPSHAPFILAVSVFSFKWNMGWMNDTLKYSFPRPRHRKYEHNKLTFSLLYAFTENSLLPFSHDESSTAKIRSSTKCRRLVAAIRQSPPPLRLSVGSPGKKLLFMVRNCPASRMERAHSLDWHVLQHDSHRGIQPPRQRPQSIFMRRAGPSSSRFRLAWLRMDRRQ